MGRRRKKNNPMNPIEAQRNRPFVFDVSPDHFSPQEKIWNIVGPHRKSYENRNNSSCLLHSIHSVLRNASTMKLEPSTTSESCLWNVHTANWPTCFHYMISLSCAKRRNNKCDSTPRYKFLGWVTGIIIIVPICLISLHSMFYAHKMTDGSRCSYYSDWANMSLRLELRIHSVNSVENRANKKNCGCDKVI